MRFHQTIILTGISLSFVVALAFSHSSGSLENRNFDVPPQNTCLFGGDLRHGFLNDDKHQGCKGLHRREAKILDKRVLTHEQVEQKIEEHKKKSQDLLGKHNFFKTIYRKQSSQEFQKAAIHKETWANDLMHSMAAKQGLKDSERKKYRAEAVVEVEKLNAAGRKMDAQRYSKAVDEWLKVGKDYMDDMVAESNKLKTQGGSGRASSESPEHGPQSGGTTTSGLKKGFFNKSKSKDPSQYHDEKKPDQQGPSSSKHSRRGLVKRVLTHEEVKEKIERYRSRHLENIRTKAVHVERYGENSEYASEAQKKKWDAKAQAVYNQCGGKAAAKGMRTLWQQEVQKEVAELKAHGRLDEAKEWERVASEFIESDREVCRLMEPGQSGVSRPGSPAKEKKGPSRKKETDSSKNQEADPSKSGLKKGFLGRRADSIRPGLEKRGTHQSSMLW